MKIKNIGERVLICKEGEIPPSSEKEVSEATFKNLSAMFPSEIKVIEAPKPEKPAKEKPAKE